MPPSTLERDLQIDGWQVVRRLGAGGMSEVYLVARGAERAALKLLYARDSPELAAQIRADVAALARLAHPSLVQIDAVGVFAGRPYLRMEYVEGRLLRDLISHPPPPPASVAALTQQLAEALAYLHARGQSHGDVTPANAVVDRAGRVRLLDVGVATSLHGSRPPVTPAYAPPEWSRAPRVDGARADAYALGVIACELLTGEFARPRAPATEAAPLDPGDAAPGPLRELIAALTEPDPRRRMTAAAAAERLVAHAGAPAPVTLAPTIAGSYEDAPPTEVTPPRQLGRYLVLRVLGAGGMGVVYLAYDPELRREVAVKVLHERTAAEGDRLRWEAQAMARLSHPNIVAVFDVGEVDGRVFFACEYIEGDTLGSVLAEERTRSWRATLSLFLAAGRGLVAAHSAGLVHRDFKPANVLVGGDGVVKVTDFGLARERPDALTTAEEVASEATPLGATDGRLVGTPVYMAAEQLRREPADARTDQFNFCVSLHMALYGAHPFAGATPAERRASVLAGARAPRPRGDAPVWLAAAIDRGLSLKPGDRWPSMAALLRAIERRLTRRRRWPAVAALAVLATSAGGYALRERAAQARCEAQGASIRERWDAATRGRVHAALRESGVGHAEDTWTRVAARIDQWTDAWRDARVSACLAARADELQARARGRCLDQDRWRLEGLLEVLVEPGRELANNAINAAAALPERDHCEEFARRPRALQGGESRELDELHRGLILARALAIAGRNDEALERIQAARAEAERLDDATARVEGLLVDGDIRGELGDYERSEALFAQAWFSALRSGHDRAAARAATELVEIVGVDRGEHARGREWGEHAAAMIDHLGADVTATMRLELTRSRALIDQEAAAYDDADAGLRRALDLAEETFGPAHPLVARSLNDLSVALYQRSRYDEARGYSDRALEVFAAAVGPLHPSYANALMSRGGLLLAVGDASGARQAFEEAARVFESAHGPDHRLVAIALGNIAAVLHAEGDFERARAYAERALAIGERVHGPQHTMVLNQRSSIAVMSLALGDSATALDQLQRGLAAAEEGLGPEHPLTSLLLVNLGAALSAEGRHEEALAASRRGLALVEALYGSDHLDVAFALVNIADTLHALGRDDEARPLAERALAIQERILGAANPTLSRSLTPLARILAARGEGVAAEGHLRRAIALLESNPGSRDLPIALTELGSLLLAEGRESEAIAPLERAITLQVDRRGFTGTLARSRFLLARALDDTGSDPSRARTLAEQARDDLASSGERDAAKRDEITEWLTQRAAKR